ncbi:DUF1328 family protein [Legionella cincinnatiensis]|uniref:UPF0391 membrane protein Lcin_0257 n=1 Tax=Legionella cincinnatiensis TaxID=28085 RepID=A0A378IJH3_9GAMM|nr:DUF1328 family protein [Legionella cincinnatiensis]KTC93219.1 hypothetical protein Lcin_0257 [Legionella cincinnatiensis]STX35080.1 Small integral membrane protein [Legionella cincinnatiensis]
MLTGVFIFFIIAIGSGYLGYNGTDPTAIRYAKIVFYISSIIFLILLITYFFYPAAAPPPAVPKNPLV